MKTTALVAADSHRSGLMTNASPGMLLAVGIGAIILAVCFHLVQKSVKDSFVDTLLNYCKGAVFIGGAAAIVIALFGKGS